MAIVISQEDIGKILNCTPIHDAYNRSLVQVTTDTLMATVYGPVGIIPSNKSVILERRDDNSCWINTGYGKYRIVD